MLCRRLMCGNAANASGICKKHNVQYVQMNALRRTRMMFQVAVSRLRIRKPRKRQLPAVRGNPKSANYRLAWHPASLGWRCRDETMHSCQTALS